MSTSVAHFESQPLERRPYDINQVVPIVDELLGSAALGVILGHGQNVGEEELENRHHAIAEIVHDSLSGRYAAQDFHSLDAVRGVQMDGRLHYDASLHVGVNVHTTLSGMCRAILARGASQSPYIKSPGHMNEGNLYADTQRARELWGQELIDPDIMEPRLHFAELSVGDTLIFFTSSGMDRPNTGAWHDFYSMTANRYSMVTGVYAVQA